MHPEILQICKYEEFHLSLRGIKNKDMKAGNLISFERAMKSLLLLLLSVVFYNCTEDNKKFDFTSYFADTVCSELKEGITLDEINDISNTFFKNLALDIYHGNYDKAFRAQEYRQYQHPKVMAGLNKTNLYSLLDNPTGIFVKKGETFTVIADLKGADITICSVDLSLAILKQTELFIHVKDGVNNYKAKKDGLLYVIYHTKSKTGTQDNILLNIIGGTVNGYFDSQKHTQDDWPRILNKATYRDFDVLGKYAHLTFPTASFKANTPDGKALINKYDELVYLEQDFMGLVKYDKMFQNRMHFFVDYVTGYYMHSRNFGTGYTVRTMDMMTTLSEFQKDVWGPAHEVGHSNQTRPGMKWSGMTEVTCNIHSLHVQTSFGNTARLITDKYYDYAFSHYVNKNIAHISINYPPESGVFFQLIPFWQLKLYLVDALGKDDFYKDLYELYRTTTFSRSGSSSVNGFYQLQFVENVCKVANLDLTDFFRSWGFLTPVDKKQNLFNRLMVTQADIDIIINRIAAQNYPKPLHNNIYDIHDNNVSRFKPE